MLKSNCQLHLGQDGKPLSGVGRGVGLKFVESYFPEAEHTIRIASGYFRIDGYDLSRKHIDSKVQLQILVSRGEGKNVNDTLANLVQELLTELGQTAVPLCDAVEDIVRRIEQKRFVIKGAWETQNRYRFHCKFYIMDDKCMWSGSANYTRPGLNFTGNEEQAVLSRNSDEIKLFTEFYDFVISKSHDLLDTVYECLKTWLEMATPFDAYLKILHYWYRQEDFVVGPNGKIPTYFQEGIITRTVEQIKDFDGALLLIATGLGKTVIGAEVARRVTSAYLNPNIIVLAPKSIQKQWDDELDSRKLRYNYFDNGLLFKNKSEGRHHQVNRLLNCLELCNETTILIIDEAHRYRRLLQTDAALQKQNNSDYKTKFNLVKERVSKALRKKTKVLLLTATPYGTDRQNINSLLHLLPTPAEGTREDLLDTIAPWNIKTLDELIKLPIVTILGIVHLLKMACDRGDTEEDGRIFIAMASNAPRKYLPKKIILYREEYSLFLEEEIQFAFVAHAFEAAAMPIDVFNEQDDRNESVVADAVRNSAIQAWLSSQIDFNRVAQFCSNIPDKLQKKTQTIQLEMVELFPPLPELSAKDEGDNDTNTLWSRYKANFKLSLKDRRKILEPLLLKLKQELPEKEEKFVRLQRILTLHTQQSDKVIVFVKRHTTAVHLSEMLGQTNPEIRIGCTVQKEKDDCTLKTAEHRKDIIEHFCPRSSDAKDIQESEETNILICTDADGVGINMQDACVVINYDLPSGADELFQRAGRVLRMTDERNRIVHLYTFEPKLLNHTTQVAENISRKISKLRERHDSSRNIVGGSILPDIADLDAPFEIPLAYEQDIISLPTSVTLPEERLQSVPNPILAHISVLERNAKKASTLPITMLSAKNINKQEPFVFVLIKYDNRLHPVLYNIKSKKLESTTIEEALKLLQCNETEQRAVISPHIVESKAIEAVEAWCQEKHINPISCKHPCAVYLKPKSSPEEDMKNMLSERRFNKPKI